MYVACRLLVVLVCGDSLFNGRQFNWVCCIGPRGIEWRHAPRDWRTHRSSYNTIKYRTNRQTDGPTDGRTAVRSETELEWCFVDVEIKETIASLCCYYYYYYCCCCCCCCWPDKMSCHDVSQWRHAKWPVSKSRVRLKWLCQFLTIEKNTYRNHLVKEQSQCVAFTAFTVSDDDR